MSKNGGEAYTSKCFTLYQKDLSRRTPRKGIGSPHFGFVSTVVSSIQGISKFYCRLVRVLVRPITRRGIDTTSTQVLRRGFGAIRTSTSIFRDVSKLGGKGGGR